MNPEQLRKILQLEKSKGYSDTAVSGGLDKYLANIPPSEYESLPPPHPSYRALDRQQREAWISSVLGQRFSPPSKPTGRPAPPISAVSLDDRVSALRSVSSTLATKFGNLGVYTLRDLLYFFPHRHIDYSRRCRIAELQIGVEQTVLARVWEAVPKRSFRGMRSTEAIVGDETGTVRVIWFNQPYLAKQLKPNTPIALSGRIEVFKGQRVFQSPEYELLRSADLVHTGRLVPVYSLTAGMYLRQVRKAVREALDACLPRMTDFLPHDVRSRAHLIGLAEAIRQAHYPDNDTARMAARRRLAFDELLVMQLGVLDKRRQWEEGVSGITLDAGSEEIGQFLMTLPFELTSAQKRTLDEIRGDVLQPRPMSRLVQGDVGSGKTVVALAAMCMAVANGCQAVMMAPTEILAEQHFQGICRLLGDAEGEGPVRPCAGITVGLLSGGMPAKAKQEMHRRIADGEIDILIGTHAVIQKGVAFPRLGLAVVDEQHRFGVMQRLALREKGIAPHMLVMSATPIPRTLAMTLYGDLDISLIDELPPGRQPIKTKWLRPAQRRSGYQFVRKQITEGRQAFIICPLVEESESIDAKAAVAEYERLSQGVFPDLRLGLLHGRMSAKEKDEVMRAFRHGETDILVSTSVVEVGVDVPNATVMVVEGAERFGLSQLHQFRGRVWRSSHQGYCILLSDNPTPDGRERLSIMEQTHNGFVLAEEDLKLRGPGEFFGTRQSGLPDLKMARLTDVKLLEMARAEAKRLFELDPELEEPEHQLLASEMARLWEKTDTSQ